MGYLEDLQNLAGQTVAGTGAYLSNIWGSPIRLGPGGSSLGANIAGGGLSQPYFEGMYSPNVVSPVPSSSAVPGFEQMLVEQGKMQPTGNITPPRTPTPTSGGRQPSTPADSELTQLLKIAATPGGLNPSQKTRLGELLGLSQAQQQPQGISDEELNQIYSPAFAAIERQGKALEAQQPGEQQAIEGNYARGIEGVTGQQAEAQTQLANRTTASQTTQESALANARQLYNELSQRYGAMFGGRSSAGPFAQELLGRETTKRFGEIGTASEQDRQGIADETARLGRWVDTQKNEWGRKKDEALRQLQVAFTQQLGQINAQRGQLESQKARERSTALQNVRDRQAAVDQADRDFQQKLALFQAEKQSQLTTTPQYAMNSWNTAVQGQYNPSQMSQTGNQRTTGGTVAGGRLRYNAYGKLINEKGEVVG